MGHRPFPPAMSLDLALEVTEFTLDALEDHPSTELQALATPLVALLEEGEVLFLKQRKARRTVVRANARVRGADAFADDEFRELNRAVLAAVSGDRKHPFFEAVYAGLAPGEIEAMSLVPELDELERIAGVLSSDLAPPSLAADWLPRIDAIIRRGRNTLEARKNAMLALTDINEQARRWIERTDRRRLAIQGQLKSIAAERGYSRAFEDRFFPEPTGKRSTDRLDHD
ncbi:MAG: hypothetical protein U0165_12425 [Polyangiaceae bacterium]